MFFQKHSREQQERLHTSLISSRGVYWRLGVDMVNEAEGDEDLDLHPCWLYIFLTSGDCPGHARSIYGRLYT